MVFTLRNNETPGAVPTKADDSEEVSYNMFLKDGAEHCTGIIRYMVVRIDE